LRELHRTRNRRPIADTIGELLAITRAHAGFANWQTGEQALANVARLIDMARRAERNGVISFRSFVDWLEDQAENGEAADAPIIEEGVGGVRIMTVHKAKGLEFPVVILCDLTAKEAREPTRWVDPRTGTCVMKLCGSAPPQLQSHAEEEKRCEREEAARILYVAATRARDLLVVTAVGDQQFPVDGWLGALSPAIYPAEAASFNPESKQPPGCPAFGDDNVVSRPRSAFRPKGSVSPGLHRLEAVPHSMVWWDPSALELGKEEGVGSRLNRLLAADEQKVRSEAGIRAHADWQANRDRVREASGAPSLKVLTATEHAAQMPSPPGAGEVVIEQVGEPFERPHSARFGTLVHAVLSVVDLNAERDSVERAAELQGRLLGCSQDEVGAATETVTRALVHPILRRASAASKGGRCRRESPVCLRLEDGTLVEGIVDLAFVDAAGHDWTVVDFKTDRELEARLDEYRHQVALYTQAVSKATGRGARGILLKL
jgi:ATP-dependent exoDNAse (exonuclease V) beta subunit